MIRILQSVNVMNRAGLETMLMNYYRNMDCSEIQFDFLTHRSEIGAYEEEIKAMGGKIFHAPRLYPKNYMTYFKYMKAFFLEHAEYKIIHSHIDSMSYFPLQAAKKSNIPLRIGHCHTSRLEKDLKMPIKYWALKQMPKVANCNFACSNAAGNFMYPKEEFQIIHNAIDLDKFSYNEVIRGKVRKQLGVDGKFVVGHVGRYCHVKNQMYLLQIFSELLAKKSNCVLFLIGKGEDENKLRNRVKKMGLQDKVFFLIDRADVDRLYQAMDVFILTSLYEGLPVVAVEAQAGGLPCLVSDKISSEVVLTSNIKRLSLNAKTDQWVQAVLSMDTVRNPKAKAELTNNGYDIKTESKKLQEWYIRIYQSLQKGMTER